MSSRKQDRHDDMISQNRRYNQGETRHKLHQGEQPDQNFDQNGANTNTTNTTPLGRSPDDKKRKRSFNDIEAEREARMARLRAENEQEERKLVTADQSTSGDHFGSKTNSDSRGSNKFRPKEEVIQVDEEELIGLDDDEQMKLLLGFTGGFGSTKNTKVDDNHNTSASGAAAKNKARKYRQYMNRKNGFNRPLDKMN